MGLRAWGGGPRVTGNTPPDRSEEALGQFPVTGMTPPPHSGQGRPRVISVTTRLLRVRA